MSITSLLVCVLLFTSLVNAGGCDHWWEPCGEVDNDSSYTMAVTLSLGSGPHWCQVWNWDGGSKVVSKRVKCEQTSLAAHKHLGGGTVDVDAFTYVDRDYTVSMYGGAQVRKTKGVWTKVQDDEEGACKDNGGTPKCTVKFSL